MNARDFAMGYAVGWNDGLGKGGGSGEDTDWQPPADWLTVPEPGDYDINLLIYIKSADTSVRVLTTNPESSNTGLGALSYDWGDGTVVALTGAASEEARDGTEWNSQHIYHKYTEAGQYVIKVRCTEQNCFLQEINANYLLIAKLGSGIILNNGSDSHTQAAFYQKQYLCYVKCAGKFARQNAFYGCYSLQKVDTHTPAEKLPSSCFSNCRCLKSFDFSAVKETETNALCNTGFENIDMPLCTKIGQIGNNPSLEKISLPLCTEIGANAICDNYSLKEVNAPLCASVGDKGLAYNYKLTKVTLAADCTFGSQAFYYCFSMYSRPDGATVWDY